MLALAPVAFSGEIPSASIEPGKPAGRLAIAKSLSSLFAGKLALLPYPSRSCYQRLCTNLAKVCRDRPSRPSRRPRRPPRGMMAGKGSRERFVPFAKAEVVDRLCADGRLGAEEQESFRAFCTILQSLFHFEFHERLERLKRAFAPFDPDAHGSRRPASTPTRPPELERALAADLGAVLDRANYEPLSDEDLQRALSEQSPLFRLNLDVDFDDFESFEVYWRGKATRTETIPGPLGLRSKRVEVPVYERVVLYLHFKPEAHFRAKRGKRPTLVEPGSVLIKLFRNVPQPDLEMIFPNTRLRMKRRDLALVLVPAVGGLVTLVPKIALLAATLWALVTTFEIQNPNVLIGTGALATGVLGFVFRQWDKYKSKKLAFMKAVSDRLYFQNMANNASVLRHIIDSAEEEECKEAMVAYYFLLAKPRGMTVQALDRAVERWFEDKHGVSIDFEVDDALGKLERLGLSTRDEAGTCRVLDLARAKERLDFVWDNYFQYNQTR